jgi:hypothetical protein
VSKQARFKTWLKFRSPKIPTTAAESSNNLRKAHFFRSDAFDVVAVVVATSRLYGESATGLFQTREISKLVTSG